MCLRGQGQSVKSENTHVKIGTYPFKSFNRLSKNREEEEEEEEEEENEQH